jgi:hypothetical protein
MLIKKDRTGKTKSIFTCDRCNKRLISGTDTRYKISVYKAPKTYITIDSFDLCEQCYSVIVNELESYIGNKKLSLLYTTKERSLTKYRIESEPIYLTKREGKLLEVLANGQLNTFEEIANYIYGYYDKYTYRTILSIKSLLHKKTKLDISVIRNGALRLDNIIYIE